MNYSDDKIIIQFPPMDKIISDYFPLSGGKYIKLSNMSDKHILQEITNYKYDNNLVVEMVIRLFKDKVEKEEM